MKEKQSQRLPASSHSVSGKFFSNFSMGDDVGRLMVRFSVLVEKLLFCIIGGKYVGNRYVA